MNASGSITKTGPSSPLLPDDLPLRDSVPTVRLGGVPGDARSSCAGAGTLEALEVTKILESANIPCCVVGISGLIYFGAGRVRHDWEICVPTESLEKAARVFHEDPHNKFYEPFEPTNTWVFSLLHTFPRFKLRGYSFFFLLIPSEDAHIECIQEKMERSKMGLPYPRLNVFAQSLLDTHDRVALTDLVDGMDLDFDWGNQNLDLNGTYDVPWTERKNEKIRNSVELTATSCMLENGTNPFSRREIWEQIVSRKRNRIGLELPKEYYKTKFRSIKDEDPRLRDRDYC